MINRNELLEFIRNIFCARQRVNEKIAKEFFLTPIDTDMLTFIYLYPDIATAAEIERLRNIKKNTLSIHVENLVQIGLVERREVKGDRRKVILVLTDKAVNIALRCAHEYENLGKKLCEGLTEEEIETMHKYVEVINRNAMNILNN